MAQRETKYKKTTSNISSWTFLLTVTRVAVIVKIVASKSKRGRSGGVNYLQFCVRSELCARAPAIRHPKSELYYRIRKTREVGHVVKPIKLRTIEEHLVSIVMTTSKAR